MPEGMEVPDIAPMTPMGTGLETPTIVNDNMSGPDAGIMDGVPSGTMGPINEMAVQIPEGGGGGANETRENGAKPGDGPNIPTDTSASDASSNTTTDEVTFAPTSDATTNESSDVNNSTNQQQVQSSQRLVGTEKTEAAENVEVTETAAETASAADRSLSTGDGQNDATSTDQSENAGNQQEQNSAQRLANSVLGYLRAHAREIGTGVMQFGMGWEQYENQRNEAEKTKVTGALAKSAALAAGLYRIA